MLEDAPKDRIEDDAERGCERAGRFIAAFMSESGLSEGDGYETAVGDMLTDFLHFASQNRFSFWTALGRATFHYGAEISDARLLEADYEWHNAGLGESD